MKKVSEVIFHTPDTPFAKLFYSAEIVPPVEHFSPIVVILVTKLYLNFPVAETFAPDFEESREANFHPDT